MRQDHKYVLAMIAVSGSFGLIEPQLPNAGQTINALAVAQAFVFSVLFFAWCKAHARAHGIAPPYAAPLLLGLFPPLGLPYYAFRAFGPLGGAKLLALGVLSFVLLFVVNSVCYLGSGQFA